MQITLKKIIISSILILSTLLIAAIAYRRYQQSHFVWTPDPNRIPRDHLFTLEEAQGFLREIGESRQKLERAIASLADQKIELGSLLSLTYACSQYDLVKNLIEHGADIDAYGEPKKYNPPVLAVAVANNDIPMATYLLEHGANIKSKDLVGEPLIFNAILAGFDMTKFLIAHGADIHALQEFDRTTLHEAAHFGNRDIVELCLKAGIPVDVKDSIGRTALFDATYPWPRKKDEDPMQVTELLIAKGAKVTERDNYGITPLHEAARYRCNAMIPLLLNHSAELDAEDNQGITPFFMAAYSGNYDGFKLLLEKGANLNHKTKDGATALHFAATPEIAEFLIKNNFDVNVRDNNGLTPLHYAVECTCIDQYTHLYTKKGKDYRVLVDVVKFLLDSGADVNARDNNGTQPLDCAEGNGDSIFTKILKERVAKQSSTPYKKACADK